MENSLTADDAKRKVEHFLSATEDARHLSERCRDYFDNKQWTSAEKAKLASRSQAAITVNRVKPKVEGLLGLYDLRLSDPKAYPRTKKHEKASEVITDGLRYVAEDNQFSSLRLNVAENFFIEGYGGAMVDVRQKKSGEIEIKINQAAWDRIYFDPHSREKDFSDARFMGLILWMDKAEAEEKFPDAEIEALINAAEYTDETFEDRPRWVDRQTNRVRIALHFEIIKGVWSMCAFSGDTYIIESQPSPYLDDDGEPCNPIELVSANVDRENNRYGEVAGFLDQQDEINHRRSKFLHNLSSRQTHGRKGSIKDVPALKREMKKPDGHIEWEGEEFGKDFGVIPTNDMARGQFELYQDAKAELDAVSFNAQLAGERQSGSLSGVAINRLQQAGTIELNRQYSLLAGWEKRIYRQIWARIKQFWTQEKWIRVTDDQDALRWVGFNTPLTAQKFLEEKINDESLPLTERQQASAAFQFMVQNNDPRLNAIVGVSNDVAELDVDIIIDQSFDVINIQQEQFQMLAQFAQGNPDIDIIDLIDLSQIRGKDALIEKLEKRRQAAAEAAGNVNDVKAQVEKAKMFKTAAEADHSQAKADQTKIENALIEKNEMQGNNVALHPDYPGYSVRLA